MNSFILFLTLFINLPLLLLKASDSTMPEIKIKEIESLIENRQISTQTLRAQFTQSVLPQNHPQPILSEGSFQYQKPQKLRIDFKIPDGEGMILTPTETTTWKKGLLPKSTPHNPLKPSFKRIILEILEKKPSAWDSQFYKSISTERNSILVTLTPRILDEKSPEQVQVRMRSSDFQITEIHIALRGILWDVKFHSIEINPALKIKLTR